MFTCDWCILIHFVCFGVSRLVSCDRPVSDNVDNWFSSLFLSSTESFLVLQLGKCVAL